MTINLDDLKVEHNTAEQRFEVALDDDDMGVIDYRKRNNTYIMVHTEVPAHYSGQGVAGKLVHDALEMVKAEGATILPYCPYVSAYLRRHPEYQSLVQAPPAVNEEM